MTNEDYVSFETAKLLKEKGFGGECFSMYLTPKPHSGMGDPNEAKIAPHGRDSHYYDGYLYQCEAPTLQMAMKWLREVHHKFICIDEHYYVIDKISHIADGFSYSFDIKHINSIYKQDGFTSYEQACEAAIKYCLENLI